MRIITEDQYKLAKARVEELLPLVDDNTPLDAPKAVELMMMSDIQVVTQKQIAKELGVSPTRVNDFVSGKSEPSLSTAGKICHLLRIRPAAMLML